MRAFDKRAVDACERAMRNGTLCQRHVRDVLKAKLPDVSPMEKFLDAEDAFVRLSAARVVGLKGDVSKVISVILKEEDREVLIDMMSIVAERGEGFGELGKMLIGTEEVVRDEAIETLRRTGQSGELLPLIFDKDDVLVERVKRYMNEQ